MTDDELKRLFEANAAETRQVIDALAQRMDSGFSSVDSRMGSFEARMESGFSSVDSRMGSFEARMDSFDTRMDSFEARMESGFSSVDTRFDSLETRIEARIAQSESETRHQFGIAREAMKRDIETIAELVLQDREHWIRVEETIHRTAAETQSMIKFSHRELDQRVTALESNHRVLEETVAELQARVQQLENATH